MDDAGLKNRILHSLFEITVVLKGIYGLIELVVGLLLFSFSRQDVHKIIFLITHWGLASVSGGGAARNYIILHTNALSFSAQRFLAIYLIFYGAVNLFLVTCLVMKKIWAYPVAIALFIMFMIYQTFRLFSRHPWLLLFLSVLDVCAIILTWLEYKRLSQKPAA